MSAFDLYRIGPGPSSTHTVGPKRAAQRFVHELEADGLLLAGANAEGRSIRVGRVHRSRARHGPRHRRRPLRRSAGVGRADGVAGMRRARRRRAGALARRPPPDCVQSCTTTFTFTSTRRSTITATRSVSSRATAPGLRSRTKMYFSVGDGQILAEGESPGARSALRVPFTFATASELLALGQAKGKRIAELMRINEFALRSPGEVQAGMLKVAAVMRGSVERGLATNGILPGGGQLRRAGANAVALAGSHDDAEWAAVYATAVAEENAAGGRVVGAPSNGSAGPVAAVLQHWRTTTPMASDDGTRRVPARGGSHRPPRADVRIATRGMPGRGRRRRGDGGGRLRRRQQCEQQPGALRRRARARPLQGAHLRSRRRPRAGSVHRAQRDARRRMRCAGARSECASRNPRRSHSTRSSGRWSSPGARWRAATRSCRSAACRQRRRLLTRDARVGVLFSRRSVAGDPCMIRRSPASRSRRVAALPCPRRRGARRRLRAQGQQGGRGGGAQHDRLQARRRAPDGPLRRRRSAAADAQRHIASPSTRSPRIPACATPTASMELRGKDLNLSLIRNGELTTLEDCKPYELPQAGVTRRRRPLRAQRRAGSTSTYIHACVRIGCGT